MRISLQNLGYAGKSERQAAISGTYRRGALWVAPWGFSCHKNDAFAMISDSAYLDEAGSHDDRLLVLSGCLASVDKWLDLESEWRNILAGSPALPYLHFKELWNNPPSRPFRHLDSADKKRILDRVTKIVSETLFLVFTVSVSPVQYHALTSARFRSQNGSAYGLCTQFFLGEINNLLSRPTDDYQVLNVFIEQGHKNAHDAIKFIKGIKAATDPILEDRHEAIVGDPDPLRDKSTIKIGKYGLGSKQGPGTMLPLQVADFFASAVRRLSAKKGEDDIARTFLDAVEKRVPHYGCFISEDAIRGLVDSVSEIDAKHAVAKYDAHNLRRYLRSYGLQIREFPYGFEVDRSNTSEQDLARFMSGEAPMIPIGKHSR